MRRFTSLLFLAFGLLPGGALRAQSEWTTDLLSAARLPLATHDARLEGVSDAEIRGLLAAARAAGVPANEAATLVDTARIVRREYGPVANFGAFVQAQLAAGTRGQALAAAIRAEHARRGQGPATAGRSTRPRPGNERARGAEQGARRPQGAPGASRPPR